MSDAGKSAAREPVPVGTAAVSSRTETLARMIHDLEDQLDRVIAGNAALQKDLEAERARRLELERTTDRLEEQLRRREEEAAGKEEAQAAVHQLAGEITRLGATVDDLQQKLGASERESKRQQARADRLQQARTDAEDEVQAVEGQFERAMSMVADLRARLALLGEERDALVGRLRVSEDHLVEAQRERDALIAEVEESRNALDEIRRSLVDACVTAPAAAEETHGRPRNVRGGPGGEGGKR